MSKPTNGKNLPRPKGAAAEVYTEGSSVYAGTPGNTRGTVTEVERYPRVVFRHPYVTDSVRLLVRRTGGFFVSLRCPGSLKGNGGMLCKPKQAPAERQSSRLSLS